MCEHPCPHGRGRMKSLSRRNTAGCWANSPRDARRTINLFGDGLRDAARPAAEVSAGAGSRGAPPGTELSPSANDAKLAPVGHASGASVADAPTQEFARP